MHSSRSILRIRLVATPRIKARVRQAREQEAKRRLNRRLYANPDVDGLEDADEENGAQNIRNGRSFTQRTPGMNQLYHDPFIDDEKENDALSASEVSALHQRRFSSRSNRSDFAGIAIAEEKEGYEVDSDGADHDGDGEESESGGGSACGGPEDNLLPSIIRDPGMATPLQRKWIKAMSEGKIEDIKRRFEAYAFFSSEATCNF